MRTIAIEEHFATREFLSGPGRHMRDLALRLGGGPVLDALCDTDDGRIAAMDAAGIDLAVLSLVSPGMEGLDAADAIRDARAYNDGLAAIVARRPGRLAGFAAVPTPAPEAAADELERAVRELGFVGVMINGHTRGRYLDHPSFAPLLERIARLGVPLYLHPTAPPQAVIDASYAGFAPDVSEALATGAWGWHIETATHLLRIVLGGVFDRLPTLQLVVGHLGEGLPAMMRRLDRALPPAFTGLDRSISAVLQQNVHYTIAGFDSLPTFLDLLLQVGAERIVFSTDHPFSSMAGGRAFLEQLPVSNADRARIAHGNAERLLGV